MSIENKLTYLDGTKDAIKQAIIDKGVSVTESDTFRSYASKIGEIQSGGSGGDCPQGVVDLSDGVSNTFTLANEIKELILPSNMDNVTNMSKCFYYCNFIKEITLPELPNVTNMSECFYGCSSLTSITLPSSLPNVTNMYSCFQYCRSLTSITLPSNMSNLKYMNQFFANCFSLKSITLPDLPNVTNIQYCFQNCSLLTSITLSRLQNVKLMTYCFYGCSSLTSITLPDLPNVTSIQYCFGYCSSLTSITLPDLPLVTNMSEFFYRCSSLQNLSIGNINPNITTLTNWRISDCTLLTVDSLVNIMNALPTITSTKTCTIGTTNISKLSPEQLAIGTSKGWSIN